MIEFDVFNNSDKSPDMTPMIDMVFLLLIFFLLTSVFQVPAVATNLPDSSTASSITPQDVVISIKENGEIYFNDEKISLHALGHMIKHSIGVTSVKEVSIASDKGVDFASIMAVMDIARESGAESVSFLTDHEN